MANKKEQTIEVKIELPLWLLQRASTAGCQTRRVLEDETGREVIKRAIAETRK